MLAVAVLGAPAAARAAPAQPRTAVSFERVRADQRDDGRIVACGFSLRELREVRSFARDRAAPPFKRALRAAIIARRDAGCPAEAAAPRATSSAAPLGLVGGLGALAGALVVAGLGSRRRREAGGVPAPSLRDAAAGPLRAIRDTAAVPALARAQAAWALVMLGTWVHTVALTVFAFRAGGATAVGLAFVIRSLPSALAGPAVGALADRFPRGVVMAVAALVTAVALALSAVAAATGAPAGVVYGLGLLVVVAGMAFRSAQSALLPSLAREPRDLAASNILTTTIESAAVFVGPVIAAALLALAGLAPTFGVAAALLFAAAMTMGVRPGGAHRAGQAVAGVKSSLRSALSDPTVRLVLGLLLAQTFVSGALTVFYALCAIELLGLGESGVGLLTAAYGAGGVIAALGAFTLVGTTRLVGVMVAGLLLWGLPLAFIGLSGDAATALFLLAAVGVGNVLFDVSTVTLLQRAVPDAVLARVFGVLEAVVVVGLGLGALAAPLLSELTGLRTALIAVGALLPVCAVLARAALRRADLIARIPVQELGVLRRIPLLADLPGPVLENLAFRSRTMSVPAGRAVVTQGEIGDRFYAIAEGRVRYVVDGREAGEAGPGDAFGELALLRDAPRAATVMTLEDTELVALDRDPFLAALTGTIPTAGDAEHGAVAARTNQLAVARRAP